MPNRFLVPAAAAMLLLAGGAFAQQQPTTAPATPQQTQRAAPVQPSARTGQQAGRRDREFVREAATGGMAEVELGKLAQQNAGSAEVRQFGQRMVHDHSAANEQLQKIASAQGFAMPQQLSKKYRETRERLSRLHGAAFDHAYIKDMIKDHNEDIKAFRRQAQSGHDQTLRQYASQTLPVLETHDRLAHEMQRSLTATGSSQRPR